MSETKYNIPLLLAAKRWLLEHPDRVRMESWITSSKTDCGTVACIGGAMVCMAYGIDPASHNFAEVSDKLCVGPAGEPMMHRAFDALGVPWQEKDGFEGFDVAGKNLFLVCHWPSTLRSRYEEAVDEEDRAAVVAERINMWIRAHTQTKAQAHEAEHEETIQQYLNNLNGADE